MAIVAFLLYFTAWERGGVGYCYLLPITIFIRRFQSSHELDLLTYFCTSVRNRPFLFQVCWYIPVLYVLPKMLLDFELKFLRIFVDLIVQVINSRCKMRPISNK